MSKTVSWTAVNRIKICFFPGTCRDIEKQLNEHRMLWLERSSVVTTEKDGVLT